MRKRLALSVTAFAAAALLFPASPAQATTCYIEEPGVDDVYCLLYGTPGVYEVCRKSPLC